MKPILRNDTITAIATPLGEGGIGIVRLSGKESLKIAKKIFITRKGSPPKDIKSHTVIPGFIVDPVKKTKVDEVLLTFMESPKTYTREDTVEISAHGSMVSLRKILSLTIQRGARLARPGEFTLRAFLNGRMDLIQAESVLEIIRAKNEEGLQAAVAVLNGGLSDKIKSTRENLLDILAKLEASIDLTEEDIETISKEEIIANIKSIIKETKKMLKGFDTGRFLKNGPLVVITGKPNVGKSSLFNILLEADRAIVTPSPGTTRDMIEEGVSINGIHLRIMDTAGIRKKGGSAETEGARRAINLLTEASLILFVIDASRSFTEEDRMILKAIKGKEVLLILNKTDLQRKLDPSKVTKLFLKNKVLKTSIKHRKGIKEIKKSIASVLSKKRNSPNGSPVLLGERHRDILIRTNQSLSKSIDSLKKGMGEELVAIDLREAVECLEEATGERFSEDLLERIFKDFCVGK